MGATLDGYTSDMTRMAYMGTPPKRVRELYRAVLEAQLAGINAVRPGVPVYKVDAAARDVLKRHKLDKEFVHSTGHGLGLEIHEMPKIGKKDEKQERPAPESSPERCGPAWRSLSSRARTSRGLAACASKTRCW